jgi:hypothetical protein
MMKEMLLMVSFRNVAKHNGADLFRINAFDVNNDKRHQKSLRLEDEYRGKLIVGNTKRFEREERIKDVPDENSAVVDLDGVDVCRMRHVHHENCGGNDDKEGGDDLAENYGNCRERKSDDADSPVPVRTFFCVIVFRRIPGYERFSTHGGIITLRFFWNRLNLLRRLDMFLVRTG